MIVQSVTKKRKRSTKKTCLQCREKHEKCDGGSPCCNCWRTDTKCVYVPLKKRGPRPGYRKKYDEKIAELEKIIAEQKKEILALKDTPSKGRLTNIQTLSSAVPAVKLMTTSIVFHYINSLHSTQSEMVTNVLLPVHITKTPLSTVSPNSFHAYATAAMGAFSRGNHTHKQQLEHIALQYKNNLNETVHRDIAAGESLLSMMYFVDGNIEKSNQFTKIANDHIRLCRSSTPLGTMTEKDQTLFRVIKWQSRKFMCWKTRNKQSEQGVNDMLSACGGDTSALSLIDKQLLVACLLQKVYNKTSNALALNKPLKPSERSHCMLRLMQVEALNVGNIGSNVRVFYEASKAKFLIYEGKPSEAFIIVKKAMEHLEQQSADSMIVLLMSKLLLEVFALLEASEDFLRCILHLKSCAKKWPMPRFLYRLLLSMKYKRPESDKVFALMPNAKYPEENNTCPKFVIWHGTKISDMLVKLQREGHNITLSDEPSIIDAPEVIQELIGYQDSMFVPNSAHCVHAKPVISMIPSLGDQGPLPVSNMYNTIPPESQNLGAFLLPMPAQDGNFSDAKSTPDSVIMEDADLMWSPLADGIGDDAMW